MQIKVDTYIVGDKAHIKAVDMDSGVSIEVSCLANNAKYFAKCCKKWVKKQVKLDAQKMLEEARREVANDCVITLSNIIGTHRRKDLVCCSEDCWCWGVDNLKSLLEQKYLGE